MAEYFVCLPLTGEMHFYVDADSPEEAIEKAGDLDWRVEVHRPDGGEVDMADLEAHISPINRGNVFYGSCGEPYADEV